jgi:hypothetical protein
VCRCGKRDPLAVRRFRKRETGEAEARPFAAQPDLGQQFGAGVSAHSIPGTVPCDSACSRVELRDHMHANERGYVGASTLTRSSIVEGQEWHLRAWANTMPRSARHSITINGKTRDWFSTSARLPKRKHPIRLVLVWREREGEPVRKVWGTNRAVGGGAYPQSLAASLEGHGELSSGREAAPRHGCLSAQEGHGPDPAHVAGLPGVQRGATDPAAGMGSRPADDRRPGRSHHGTRGLGDNHRLGRCASCATARPR